MPTVQYRKLTRKHFSTKDTLQDSIESALDVHGVNHKIGLSVNERVIDLDQDGKTTVLNGFQAPKLSGQKNIFSGQIILYRQGIDIPAIEEDLQSNLAQFKVRQYQVDDKMKPIEGVLHFVAYEDHVGLIESSAVRSRWLERYLTWLLKSASNVINEDSVVELQARFTVDGDVRPPQTAHQLFIPTRPMSNVKGTASSKTIARGSSAGATVAQLLKLLGWKDQEITDLITDLPEGSNLHGDLKIYAKQGNRNVQFQRQNLESAFRNTDPNDIILESKEGNQRGAVHKLSAQKSIKKIGALYDPEQTTKAIWEQLKDWGSEGRIDLRL